MVRGKHSYLGYMQLRQLILRSNRFLGSALVDKGLIDHEALEQANEEIIRLIQEQEVKRPCLLQILMYDLKVLNEADILDALARGAPVGMVDLTAIHFNLPPDVSPEECGATGTIPFDNRDGVSFLATTYYYSKPVRDYWEGRLGGSLHWYICTLAQMNEALETLTGEAAPQTDRNAVEEVAMET